MTKWTNYGQSIWGVWEKAGAYGVCKFPDRWRLMKEIGRTNVKVVRYDTGLEEVKK